MEIPKDLLEKIDKLNKPAVIAVSGFGGSGKSTFSEALGKTLNVPIIGVDSFATSRLDSEQSHWGSVDFNRLEKEVLIPYMEGRNPIQYGHYDWNIDGINETIDVPHSRLIIVEGIGLFRPELLKYFAYKIWVDTPLEIATARGKKRDRDVYRNPQDEKWDGSWKRNDLEYFETFKPKDGADFVVSNS